MLSLVMFDICSTKILKSHCNAYMNTRNVECDLCENCKVCKLSSFYNLRVSYRLHYYLLAKERTRLRLSDINVIYTMPTAVPKYVLPNKKKMASVFVRGRFSFVCVCVCTRVVVVVDIVALFRYRSINIVRGVLDWHSTAANR